MARVYRQQMVETTNFAGDSYRRFMATPVDESPIDERSIEELVNSGDAELGEFHPLYSQQIAVQNWNLARQ